MNRKRLLHCAVGDDQAAVATGMSTFLKEVGLEGAGIIVVPQLRTFSSTMLATLLGEQAKVLYRDRTLAYGGSTISLCSDTTLKNFRNAKVYLALWSSNYLIDEIEDLHNWRSLIWVTWNPEEAKKWVEKQSPILI